MGACAAAAEVACGSGDVFGAVACAVGLVTPEELGEPAGTGPGPTPEAPGLSPPAEPPPPLFRALPEGDPVRVVVEGSAEDGVEDGEVGVNWMIGADAFGTNPRCCRTASAAATV